MSVQAVALALNAQGVTPTQKLVLVTLAERVNGDDALASCWLGNKRIAETVGVTVRAVQKALSVLIEMDFIRRKERIERGRQTTSLTYLNLSKIADRNKTYDAQKPQKRDLDATDAPEPEDVGAASCGSYETVNNNLCNHTPCNPPKISRRRNRGTGAARTARKFTDISDMPERFGWTPSAIDPAQLAEARHIADLVAEFGTESVAEEMGTAVVTQSLAFMKNFNAQGGLAAA